MEGPTEGELRNVILGGALQIVSTGTIYDRGIAQRMWTFELRWRALPDESDEPGFLKSLEGLDGFKSLSWRRRGCGRIWRSS